MARGAVEGSPQPGGSECLTAGGGVTELLAELMSSSAVDESVVFNISIRDSVIRIVILVTAIFVCGQFTEFCICQETSTVLAWF